MDEVNNYKDILTNMTLIEKYDYPTYSKLERTLALNSLGQCIVSFAPHKVSKSGEITVKKRMTPELAIKGEFREYTVVNHAPTQDTEVYIDRDNNTMQFTEAQGSRGYNVICTFYSEGRYGLAGEAIYISQDVNGNPIKWLPDLVRDCQGVIDKATTLGKADEQIATLKNHIEVLGKSNEIIENKEDDLRQLATDMDVKIPQGESVINDLNQSMDSVQTIINRVKTNDNSFQNIKADQFEYNPITKKWEYEYVHNLGSSCIQWSVKNTATNKKTLGGCRDVNSNKCIVYTYVNQEVDVIGNKGYFGGLT